MGLSHSPRPLVDLKVLLDHGVVHGEDLVEGVDLLRRALLAQLAHCLRDIQGVVELMGFAQPDAFFGGIEADVLCVIFFFLFGD